MKLTAAQRKAAYYPDRAREDALNDATAAGSWHKGALSPRQKAGFYEVTPDRYAALIAAYRRSGKLLDACAKWRRKYPAPNGHHVGVGWGKLGSFRELRAGGLSEPWVAYYTATRQWGELTKAKKAKTPEPTPPKGDQELAHDASFMYYGKGPDTCPACAGFEDELKAWQERRSVAYRKIGIDYGGGGGHYLGREPVLWPDGSWDSDFGYRTLPIRSAWTVKRTPPIE